MRGSPKLWVLSVCACVSASMQAGLIVSVRVGAESGGLWSVLFVCVMFV